MTEEEMDRYIAEQKQGAPGRRIGYLKKYRVAKTAPNWKGKSKRVVQIELKEHECLCKQSKPRRGQLTKRIEKKPEVEPEVEIADEAETDDDWGMKQLEEILSDLDARLGMEDPMLPMFPEKEEDIDVVKPENEVELPITVPLEVPLYDDLRKPEDKEVLYLQVGKHQTVELALPMIKAETEAVPEEIYIEGRKFIHKGRAKVNNNQKQHNRWRHPSIGGIMVEEPREMESHPKAVTWKLPPGEEEKLQTDMCHAIHRAEYEQAQKKQRVTLCCPKPRRRSYSSAYLPRSSYSSSTCKMLLIVSLFCQIQPCSYAYKNGNPLVCQTHQSKTIWKLPDGVDCKVRKSGPGETPVKAVVRLYKRNHIQYKSEA